MAEISRRKFILGASAAALAPLVAVATAPSGYLASVISEYGGEPLAPLEIEYAVYFDLKAMYDACRGAVTINEMRGEWGLPPA